MEILYLTYYKIILSVNMYFKLKLDLIIMINLGIHTNKDNKVKLEFINKLNNKS